MFVSTSVRHLFGIFRACASVAHFASIHGNWSIYPPMKYPIRLNLQKVAHPQALNHFVKTITLSKTHRFKENDNCLILYPSIILEYIFIAFLWLCSHWFSPTSERNYTLTYQPFEEILSLDLTMAKTIVILLCLVLFTGKFTSNSQNKPNFSRYFSKTFNFENV